MTKLFATFFSILLLIQTPVFADVSEASSVIPEQSCHNDYVLRRKQLVRKALVTPLVGAVMFPVAVYGGAAIGASNNDPWAALIFAILGGYGAIAGTVAFESVAIIQAVKANSLVKIIEQAHDGAGPKLKKLARKMSRKLDREIDQTEVAEALVKADMSGILCDGSLRGNSPSSKLRKRLARKSEITTYLKRALR